MQFSYIFDATSWNFYTFFFLIWISVWIFLWIFVQISVQIFVMNFCMDFCTNLCMDFCPNFCTDFLSEFPYRFLYGFLCRFSSLFVTPSFPISVVLCRMLLSQLEPTECNPFPTFPPPPPALPSPSAALPCIHGVPRLLPQLHGGVVEHRTAGGLREPPQRLPQPQIWRHLDRELPFPALFWGAFLLRCCGLLRVRLGHRLFVINYVGAWWWFMWVCST